MSTAMKYRRQILNPTDDWSLPVRTSQKCFYTLYRRSANLLLFHYVGHCWSHHSWATPRYRNNLTVLNAKTCPGSSTEQAVLGNNGKTLSRMDLHTGPSLGPTWLSTEIERHVLLFIELNWWFREDRCEEVIKASNANTANNKAIDAVNAIYKPQIYNNTQIKRQMNVKCTDTKRLEPDWTKS